MGQFETPPVPIQHRSQPPADPAIVELHVRLRSEGFEYLLAFGIGEPAEVEFIVAAEEVGPLAVLRNRGQRVVRVADGPRVTAREGEKEVLVDEEVEDDVNAVTFAE